MSSAGLLAAVAGVRDRLAGRIGRTADAYELDAAFVAELGLDPALVLGPRPREALAVGG